MSDSGENVKYKWTPESTALLVSVWSDKEVQKQFEYATKPQLIWESVARYMRKKGYNVSAKHCRSRMKQLLVCYREAKRVGTREGVEQYYEAIDRVRCSKRLEQMNVNGIDTVDSAVNLRSPIKEMKTNKNLQMRHKLQEPVESLYRSEALSPVWTMQGENECPDSPESNETIIARPYMPFSPTKDAAINTNDQLTQLAGKAAPRNLHHVEETMIPRDYQQNILSGYPYFEIPYQNTVQNVQNQIIQENMQHNLNHMHQNRFSTTLPRQNTLHGNFPYQQKFYNTNGGIMSRPMNDPGHTVHASVPNPNMENVIRHNNQLQQSVFMSNQAMPQEPRKVLLEHNQATMKRYAETFPRNAYPIERKQTGSLSPDYPGNISPHLNDAFSQTADSESKMHNLNETFTQPTNVQSNPIMTNAEMTVLTNNATVNDDSFLLDLLAESPTSSERNDSRSRETGINTENVPNVPVRKKKAQKLEQLVLSAISSQNEVVNKILAAQNDMVARFLDADRDRQNKLENRLEHLLNVVHGTVSNKSGESEAEIPPPPSEPIITSLVPPPKPGIPPPKLDLVPPKPCRVPCTMPSSNVELINQNPVSTRPGVVSPIGSPSRKLGTIWSKLGPVSQSPFVKAQQRLGLHTMTSSDTRTQSSAERRIAREFGKTKMDLRTIILETQKFMESERELEERVENARRETEMGQTLTARRKLFTQREPTAGMILSAAFIETECQAAEPFVPRQNLLKREKTGNYRDDELLTGQGESYERLRQLDRVNYLPPVPCDSSTPAKPLGSQRNDNEDDNGIPKQTVQQLAQLVMNSARWKNPVMQNLAQQRAQQQEKIAQNVLRENQQYRYGKQNEMNIQNRPYVVDQPNNLYEDNNQIQNNNFEQPRESNGFNGNAFYGEQNRNIGQTNCYDRAYGKELGIKPILQNNRVCEDPLDTVPKPVLPSAPIELQNRNQPRFPIGFSTAYLKDTEDKRERNEQRLPSSSIGFTEKIVPSRGQQNLRFMDDALLELQRMYAQRCDDQKNERPPYMISNGNAVSTQNQQMIEQYVQNLNPRKQGKEGSDSDEEYLDTTMSMQPSASRKGSLNSLGKESGESSSGKFARPDTANCVIS